MDIYAVIYARYSSHGQNDASIEQQVAECREYARQHGLKVVKIYEDRALTGRKDTRPGFQRMLRDAEKGKWQFVIVYDTDRFSRNRYDSIKYKSQLKRRGIRVMYRNIEIPDTPEGMMIESLLEAQAEYYSLNLARSVKRGMKSAAQECKVLNASFPLGYKKGEDGRFEIEPTGAALVREIFDLYNSGVPTKQICDILNTRGNRTQGGKLFYANGIRKILRNDKYIGVYSFGDIRIEDGMPAIISKDVFERVQERLDDMRYRPAANREVSFLLTGKLFCGHCKAAMVGSSGTSRTKETHYYYACNNQRKHKCTKKPARKQWLEDEVVRLTMEVISNPDVVERITDGALALQERERDDTVLMGLRRQLAEKIKALDNVMDAIEQGIITPTTKTRLKALEKEKAELETAIHVESMEQPQLTREQILYGLDKFRQGDVNDEDFRIRLIEAFVQAIYLYDDKLKIVYNYTDENNYIELAIVDDVENSTDYQFNLSSSLAPLGPP